MDPTSFLLLPQLLALSGRVCGLRVSIRRLFQVAPGSTYILIRLWYLVAWMAGSRLAGDSVSRRTFYSLCRAGELCSLSGSCISTPGQHTVSSYRSLGLLGNDGISAGSRAHLSPGCYGTARSSQLLMSQSLLQVSDLVSSALRPIIIILTKTEAGASLVRTKLEPKKQGFLGWLWK